MAYIALDKMLEDLLSVRKHKLGFLAEFGQSVIRIEIRMIAPLTIEIL